MDISIFMKLQKRVRELELERKKAEEAAELLEGDLRSAEEARLTLLHQSENQMKNQEHLVSGLLTSPGSTLVSSSSGTQPSWDQGVLIVPSTTSTKYFWSKVLLVPRIS